MNDVISIFKIIPKKIWIILVVFVVISIGIIAFASVKPKNENIKNDLIVFENKDLIKAIPENELSNLRKSLYSVLKNDVGVGENQKISATEVRNYEDGSSEGNNGVEIKTAKFLVDFDEYQRTYRVIIAWVPGDKNYPLPVNPIIKCPKPDESKYPEAKCKTFTSSYKDFEDDTIKTKDNGSGKDENAK